jgi:23S rRNA-intervening sequence protein
MEADTGRIGRVEEAVVSCQFGKALRRESRLRGNIPRGKSYRDLVVWNKAMELVMEIYRLTQAFPKEEIFGLMSQLRRSAGY